MCREKAMATHSSTLAWKIPWMEEPGRLQSMGSLRVRHDWMTSLSLSSFMHWRRKWQPNPVFLPGESHGRRSLVSCSPWGRKTVGHDWSDLAAGSSIACARKSSTCNYFKINQIMEIIMLYFLIVLQRDGYHIETFKK